jgi:NitT/TauT family transport system permease protein
MTGPAPILRLILALVALALGVLAIPAREVGVTGAMLGVGVVAALATRPLWGVVLLGLAGFIAVQPMAAPFAGAQWMRVALVWLMAWVAVATLSAPVLQGWAARARGLLVPLVFGATLLWLWEMVVTGLQVSSVILPPPSAVAARFAASIPILWGDFVQTFVKGALSGYAMGCGAAFVTAIAVDRSPFLQRGLLPVGNFVAAMPIVGIAPIMVMWFGFDWQSKAAVVVVMVFFPMLVNTVEGLKATDSMQRDLMATYSASYWQALLKLRLPAAMPFVFNGLKITTTLAMIGAIVAEFFGSPTQGMGFRISTEVGRLGLDMVWAEIAVAAIAGSLFYAVVAMIEKGVTFWHPSQRGR